MRVQLRFIAAGEQVKLSCPSAGDPEPTIRWYKNDKLINGTERENGESVTIL